MAIKQPMAFVVRYDEYAEQFATEIDQRTAVVKVLKTYQAAAAEADRLNQLNGHEGVRCWASQSRRVDARVGAGPQGCAPTAVEAAEASYERAEAAFLVAVRG